MAVDYNRKSFLALRIAFGVGFLWLAKKKGGAWWILGVIGFLNAGSALSTWASGGASD